MRPIKWGIIGLGKITNKFAVGLTFVKDAELHAVASRDLAKAKKFGQEHSVLRTYGTYEDLMRDEEVDVIYIATPHSLHYELSIRCIQHGKAVLCEKPFALNYQQASEMVKAAQGNKVFLMEALWTAFLPHYQFVKNEINSGKHGKIKRLKADFGFPAEFDPEKRLFNKALGGGSLLDIGIYPVFISLDLLGQPEKIKTKVEFAETGVDIATEIDLLYNDDRIAELSCSFKERTPTVAEVELDSARIILNTRFHEPTSVTIITQEGITEKNFPFAQNGYAFEASHVGHQLRKGQTESDIWSLSQTLELMSLLDRIRAEMKLDY